MKKFLKILLCIVVIVILIFFVYLLRNYSIINSLRDKWNNNCNVNNYHITKKISQGDSYIVSDMYKLNEKGKLVNHDINLTDFSIVENTTIFSNETRTTYWDFGDGNSKSISTNSSIPEIKIPNPFNLYTKESNSNLLIELIKTHIKTISFNDKECYLISNSMFSNMYIDKETGLLLKTYNGTATLEDGEKQQIEEYYYYEFNKVQPENVEEPNIE